MLTQKQKELLVFIHKRSHEQGVTPSFDEMRDALKLKSKSGIHRLITALEERGFIRRLPHRARAIEVVKIPENFQNTMEKNQSQPSSKRNVSLNIITGAKNSSLPQMLPSQGLGVRSFLVPMMGRIAAGVPISAIQDHSQDILCPAHIINQGDHFALEVKGDSMIDAGIHDGDTVIIRRCATAENGEIVVALVEKEEATLKRLRKKGSTIALEAANPSYETRIFRPDQIAIQGRLVGLIRKY